MSELVAISFESVGEADQVLNELRRLQKEYLVDLADAVVVVRPREGEVQLKQDIPLVVGAPTLAGGLSGSLLGTLVGLLLQNPLVGFAIGGLVGAGTGALAGSLADYINDDFIRSLSKEIKPDSSALFLLVREVQPEEVLAELSQFRGKVLRTSLPPEEEARLQAALSKT